MANFKEFIGGFKKEFSQADRETYRMLYGEEEDKWPDADEYDEAPVCINLDDVCAFNEHTNTGMTTVDLRGGSRFGVKVSYEKFKDLMERHIMNLIEKICPSETA